MCLIFLDFTVRDKYFFRLSYISNYKSQYYFSFSFVISTSQILFLYFTKPNISLPLLYVIATSRSLSFWFHRNRQTFLFNFYVQIPLLTSLFLTLQRATYFVALLYDDKYFSLTSVYQHLFWLCSISQCKEQWFLWLYFTTTNLSLYFLAISSSLFCFSCFSPTKTK